MKTKEIVSYLHKQGIYLTEEQARDVAFIVGEGELAITPTPSPDTVIEKIHSILADNAIIHHRDLLDPSVTFADLDMDSLDIIRTTVECEREFGIELDIENDQPATVGELVALIEKQIKS